MSEFATPLKTTIAISLSGLNRNNLILMRCDSKGAISKLLWNSLYPQLEIKPKQFLISVVDKDSRSKAMNFLLALQKQKVVKAWDFNVTQNQKTSILYMSGLKFEEEFILIGTPTKKHNNEILLKLSDVAQSPTLSTSKTIENGIALNQQENSDTAVFDQLTELNNELVNTQRQLALKNAELTRLTEQKNRFLGMAAHDLRNPLSLVLNFSSFLLEEIGPRLNEDQLDYLEIIQNQSEFMLDLVNNFLDISTIESVGMQFNKSATNLKTLVTDNFTRNQYIFQKKPIHLHLTCPDDIPLMPLDKSKIEQVLNNLLSNAAKFSEPNSNIFITVGLDDEQVTISVQDEGPGISANEQSKLFKAFSQTSVTSTAGEASTGLGLLITKQIIDGHGGQIWLDSEVGKGTCFYFSLPLPKTELPLEQTAVSPTTQSQPAH